MIHAPLESMLPQGYLGILYIAIFLLFLYWRMMVKKLIDWDFNYATDQEGEIAMIQNKNNGVPIFINSDN